MHVHALLALSLTRNIKSACDAQKIATSALMNSSAWSAKKDSKQVRRDWYVL